MNSKQTKKSTSKTEEVSNLFQKTLKDSLSHQAQDGLSLSTKSEKYLRHLIDPINSDVALPTGGGLEGYAGQVMKYCASAKATMSVGSNGYGFVSFSPSSAQGCNDRICFITSSGAWAGVSTTNIPTTSGAGQFASVLNKLPFSGAAYALNGDGDLLSTSVIAGGMEIKPISSVTDQNGALYLLEVPTHPSTTVTELTVQEVIQHPNTRMLSAVEFGNTERICLNWHPQKYSGGGNLYSPTAAGAQIQRQELYIVAFGAAGTQFEIVFGASFMARGYAAPANDCWVQDILGFQAIMNAIAQKRLSGWVGTPHMANLAYHVGVAKSLRENLPHTERKALEARETLERGKKKGMFETIQDLIPLAKEVAGFFF